MERFLTFWYVVGRFMRIGRGLWSSLAGLLLVFGPGQATGQNAAPAASGSPAVDPTTGIVHSQRLESGVPLGGIGTGAFQIMTDGSVSHATISNNWNWPTGSLPACFAAIWIRAADHSVVRVLALNSPYQLPVIAALNYDGLYPKAHLDFPDPALPLTVSLRAFSPLVPFDIKNSSFPAAAFVFHLQNRTPVPVEVSVALSWENILGVGGTATYGSFHNRTGDTVVPVPDVEGCFGMKFTGPPLPSGTRVEDLLRGNETGEMSLLARPPRAQAVVTSAGWNALEAHPAWWDSFASDGSVSGTAPRGEEGKAHPAGVVAVRLTLKPRDSVDIPFAIAWYTPRFYTLSGTNVGHYYETLFLDSAYAARALLVDWRSLLALTEEWQQHLLFSNLPVWLVRRLINSAAPLTANSIHTRDDRFAFIGNAGSDAQADGAASHPPGTLASPQERLAASALLIAFFPSLEAQLLTRFLAAQSPEGFLPSTLGDVDHSLGPPAILPTLPSAITELQNTQTPEYRLPDAEEVDSVSALVLQAAQYVCWTGDRAFLQLCFPGLRRALSALLRNLDNGGLPALAPAAHPLRPATATLWLATLRAGQRLAEKAADREFARRCETAFAHAAAGVTARYWNGQFYAEGQDAGGGSSGASQAVCATDQLLGQWAADQLDLGPLLPEADRRRALHSLQTLNDQRTGYPFGPLARVRADGTLVPNDPEAHDCLLPASLLGEAVLSITQDQPEAGVDLLQRLEETRDNVLRSPWQSPLRFRADTGQSRVPDLASLTHAADWNALYALEGFALDLDAGRLTLVPNIPGIWRSLQAPVFAPTFWGNLEFKPMAHGGVLSLRIDRLIALPAAAPSGELSGSAGLVLRSLRVPGPPSRPDQTTPAPAVVHVSVGQTPIGAQVVRDPSGDLILTFNTLLTLAVGDRLEVNVH